MGRSIMKRSGKKQRILLRGRLWVSKRSRGLLDTNVVIHSLTRDEHAEECRLFVQRISDGDIAVIVDPLVVHEITYLLPRYVKQMSRREVGDFVESLLQMPGVSGEIDHLRAAIGLWKEHPGAGFVDCYLAVRALDANLPVFTKNVRDLRTLGAQVPDPLPIE
jgi:predicted nucleic acid-binding protein